MRKRIIGHLVEKDHSQSTEQPWLDIESMVDVEISSEDEAHPIESALLAGNSSGWRAADAGEQTVRLVFNDPQPIKRILLEFEETRVDRTQEYVLRWTNESGQTQDIVRQQWNFSPNGATNEVEHYEVELAEVKILELSINPNSSDENAIATLKQWRVA